MVTMPKTPKAAPKTFPKSGKPAVKPSGFAVKNHAPGKGALKPPASFSKNGK